MNPATVITESPWSNPPSIETTNNLSRYNDMYLPYDTKYGTASSHGEALLPWRSP
jgi:hypothetical protein